ncbi:MAG: MauE/DoxX family redox-associated membrane protein [Phycisphaerae bacterium]
MGTENGVITRLPSHAVDTALGHVLPQAVSVTTGGVLLTAAAGAALQLTHSPLPPLGLEGLPGFVPALIAWEIFLGLWLISGALPAVARRVAIGCFSVFACYAIYEAAIGRVDCGCFGQVHVNPWFTLILDLAIVLALVFLAKPVDVSARRAKRRWPVAVALGIGLAVGIFSAIVHPRPIVAASGLVTANGGKIVILEPRKWIGYRLPVLTHITTAVLSRPGAVRPDKIPLSQRLAHGQWVVLFYHASCDECRQAIPAYEALAQRDAMSGKASRVAFIRVPSDPATPRPPGLFHTNTALHGTLDDTHEWFATTPTAVELRNAVVMRSVGGNAALNLGWLH